MSMRDLQLKVALKMVDRLSGPAKKANLVNRKLSTGIRDTRKSIANANQQARKVEYLKNLGGQVNVSASKLSQAQDKVKRLRQELSKAKQAGKPVTELSKQLTAAGQNVSRLSKKQTTLRKATNKVRGELKAAGIDTGKLGQSKQALIKRTEQLNKKLARQQKLLTASSKAGAFMSNTLSKLGSAVKWVSGGIVAGGLAAMPLINTASTFEGYQATLETIEGSQAKAKTSMKWVSDFAAKTPSSMAEVTESFVRLRAYGLDPTSGLMKTLSDTGSAMGKPVMQAVEAMADAVTGENERLKEFGIKARAEGDLFKYEYTDKNGVQRTMAALKDDRKQIESVLTKIWNEKYAGAGERQAKTWRGLMSNLGDQWTRFQIMVMDSGPFARIKKHLGDFLKRVDEMANNGQLKVWAEKTGAQILYVMDAVATLAQKFWSGIKTIGQATGYVAQFVGGWQNLGLVILAVKFAPVIKGLGLLASLAMGHPLIALATVLAAGALAIIMNWDKITTWAAPYWETLKTLFIGAGQAISDFFFNWTPLGLIIKHWDDIKAYFVALPGQFTEFGRSIINSLGAGIDERLQWIKSKVTGLGDFLPDWLKEKVGIEGEVKAPPAISQKTSGVLPKVMAATMAASSMAATPALASNTGSVNTTINETIQVHAAPGMNEQDLAQKVAQEVAKLNQKQAARNRARIHDEV
ncbi:MAG: tape measure protein [Candidatus Pacearchaeota archaeon]|nr:tape measure protein [Candidatus Pacearchaeota archaeon]